MSLMAETDALQVAMVRLRLENVPCRIVTRQDMVRSAAKRVADTQTTRQPLTAFAELQRTQKGPVWPFTLDRCVIFCRTKLQPGERTPVGVMVAHLDIGYVLADGVEQALREEHGSELYSAAMALRGIGVSWMQSGAN